MHGDYKTDALSLLNFLKAAPALILCNIIRWTFSLVVKKILVMTRFKRDDTANDRCNSTKNFHIETPPIYANQLFEMTFWTRGLYLNNIKKCKFSGNRISQLLRREQKTSTV